MVTETTDYEAGQREAEERIVAWLRKEALRVRHSDSITGPEWCDAMRWTATRIELGEHTAAADDELEAFSLAAREFNAFLRAGEVHRNAVVLLSGAVSGGFSVGDALLAHDVDRFFDSSIIHRGGVTLEVQRLA